MPTLNQRIQADAPFDAAALRARMDAAAGGDGIIEIAASTLAERLLGDAIFANLVLLGAAFQSGSLPQSLVAIQRAIDLNGDGAEANHKAFTLGRLAIQDAAAVANALAGVVGPPPFQPGGPVTLEALTADRTERLRAYGGAPVASRYAALVQSVAHAEARAGFADAALARAVASAFYRLLAVKDEYEVARLYSDGEFKAELDRRFEPGYVLRYHLAPPLLARRDAASGRPRKYAFGPWLAALWPALVRLRGLRGTWFDPFGHTAERRMERALADEYEAALRRHLEQLTPQRHALLLEYAALPERIRGFGVVKLRSIEAAQAQAAPILAQLREPPL